MAKSSPIAATATVLQAVRHGLGASFPHASTRADLLKLRAVTAFLHLFQPAARLWGRVGYGLTPLRRQLKRAFALPRALPGQPIQTLSNPRSPTYVGDASMRARVERYYGLDRYLLPMLGTPWRADVHAAGRTGRT